MSLLTEDADPLFKQPRAERPAFATGLLLDAQDFTDEQTYHRGRLARALAFLAGGGTLAGLRVEYVPPATGQVEEIRVQPGLAVDRLGRLVELLRPACIRLDVWFTAMRAAQGGAQLTGAAYGNLARFISPRFGTPAPTLPANGVVADVYLRFGACPVGLSSSFATGPFDALNAVSTSRLRDAYELQLVPRAALDDSYSGLPLPPAAAVLGNPAGSATDRRNALQDAVLSAYGGTGHVGGNGDFGRSAEQPTGVDPSAVFLARVLIPVTVAAGSPPVRSATAPLVDNFGRRFLPPAALFAQWAGA